jgi:CheY-like chemotaxis protein
MLVQTVFDRQQDKAYSNWSGSSSIFAPALPSSDQLHLSAPTDRSPELPPLPHTTPDARILVVEDSITSRQALVFTLEKAGYEVFQAKDGQEAIAQLQHQSNIRLVICDIEMPTMNGFEFLGHIQKMPDLSHVPVLILSSRSDQAHRSLASQLGATAYMTKPYIEHKLLAVVTNLFGKHY